MKITEGVEGMACFAIFEDGSKEKCMHVNEKKGLYIEEHTSMAVSTPCKVKDINKKVIHEASDRVSALCFVADFKPKV